MLRPMALYHTGIFLEQSFHAADALFSAAPSLMAPPTTTVAASVTGMATVLPSLSAGP